MNILEYYQEMNKDRDWVEKFRSTAAKNYGKTFIYINTNFRSLSSFEDIFIKFYSCNGLERKKWKVNSGHGQEEAKQWVTNMAQSKLFKKDGDKYNLTAKGTAFSELLSAEFTPEERWVLIYLFLLNSYFGLKPNYILKTVSDIFEQLSKFNLNKDQFINQLECILKNKNLKIIDLFKMDIFWIISFLKDDDFLTLFLSETEVNKKKLFDFVIKNYSRSNFADVISYKYKPSGNYTKNTFVDDLKVIYFTKISQDVKLKTLNEYIDFIIVAYSSIYSIDKIKVYQFIRDHDDIFEIIYNEVFGNIDADISEEFVYVPKQRKIIISEEKIDDTTADNSEKIINISYVLKRMAKEKSKYKCELENLHNCKYFTSKENKQNYLEIHHFIPREFSNEFEQSIEILQNYVALCPHCHRLIHFATDRERKYAITNLFKNRIDNLKKKNLEPSLKQIYDYYGIEE